MRKIISITFMSHGLTNGTLIAVCDDGSIWTKYVQISGKECKTTSWTNTNSDIIPTHEIQD